MPIGGNRTDVTTVEDIVVAMEARYGLAQRISVMDRGMTSEDNLECQLLDRECFRTQADARLAIFDFIEGRSGR